jgi:hypothetical protein
MALVPLSSWIAIGVAIGAILVTIWRTRRLTLAWGIIVGGAGGSFGGLIGRMVLPDRVFAAPFLGAVVGAVLAMLIGRAEEDRHRPSAV